MLADVRDFGRCCADVSCDGLQRRAPEIRSERCFETRGLLLEQPQQTVELRVAPRHWTGTTAVEDGANTGDDPGDIGYLDREIVVKYWAIGHGHARQDARVAALTGSRSISDQADSLLGFIGSQSTRGRSPHNRSSW